MRWARMADAGSDCGSSRLALCRTFQPMPTHRSSHWLMGCTVLLRHTLQHCAGPTGTTCPRGESLRQKGVQAGVKRRVRHSHPASWLHSATVRRS